MKWFFLALYIFKFDQIQAAPLRWSLEADSIQNHDPVSGEYFYTAYSVQNLDSHLPLLIQGIDIPGGNCEPNKSLEPILPGKKGRILIRCRIQNRGAFKKEAIIRTSFGEQSISIHGEVHEPISFKKNELGNWLMQSDNCRFLVKEMEALASWSKKVGEPPGKIPSCNCHGTRCSIDINSQVPAIIREKQSVCNQHEGPNCWNSVLYSQKLLTYLRYSTPEEMKLWMDSPLCTERRMDEKPQPGDIIAIRNHDQSEVHGFIYLSENLCFSKNTGDKQRSFLPDVSYRLQSPPDGVFKLYKVEPECRGYPNFVKASCKRHVTYFSCKTLDEFREMNPGLFTSDFERVSKALGETECTLGKWEFSAASFSTLGKQNILQMRASVKALKDYAQQVENGLRTQISQVEPTKKEEINKQIFLWKTLQVKAAAVEQNFE